MRVAITGTSRGIGLELVRQFLERKDTVDAVAREPERSPGLEALARRFPSTLRVYRCDVTEDGSVAALARALDGVALDVLINNAGVGGEWASLEGMDLANVVRTFEVNAVAPLRVTRALLPSLRRGRERKVAHLSSRMGSISQNNEGGAYAYRMSKAALNMGARSMAADLQGEGITVAVLHPGWVQTQMGGAQAPTPLDVSVRGLLRVIDSLTPAHAGRFFDFKGEPLPW